MRPIFPLNVFAKIILSRPFLEKTALTEKPSPMNPRTLSPQATTAKPDAVGKPPVSPQTKLGRPGLPISKTQPPTIKVQSPGEMKKPPQEEKKKNESLFPEKTISLAKSKDVKKSPAKALPTSVIDKVVIFVICFPNSDSLSNCFLLVCWRSTTWEAYWKASWKACRETTLEKSTSGITFYISFSLAL